jgi:hypothetical protein
LSRTGTFPKPITENVTDRMKTCAAYLQLLNDWSYPEHLTKAHIVLEAIKHYVIRTKVGIASLRTVQDCLNAAHRAEGY